MLYYLLKPLANIFMRVYYRLQVKGRENVPFDKPVVLAPNHVNAFIDPIVIGMLHVPKVRFFARGDVFKGPVALWALNSMNISPMYRMSEGYSDVRKNDKTFDECRELLSQRKCLLIFPEGICIQQKRIERFKKGLARILLGVDAADGHKEDICIIPVGLNYSNAKNFRSRLFIRFGEPVHIHDFHKMYEEDKVKAINECSRYMESQLAKLLVIVENPEDDVLYEGITEIYVRQWIEESGGDSRDLEIEHLRNQQIAATISQLRRTDLPRLESLRDKVLPYLKELDTLKLRDHLFRKDKLEKISVGSTLKDFFKLWFGLLPYWLGLALNFPPYRIARNMAQKIARNVEFHASIYANAGMFLWIFYYVIQLVIAGLCFHNKYVLLSWAVLVPLSGWYALNFYPAMKKIFGRWRLLGLVRKQREDAARLINEREEIVRLIREILDK